MEKSECFLLSRQSLTGRFKERDTVNIQLNHLTHQMWHEKSPVCLPFSLSYFLNKLENVESLSGVEPAKKTKQNTCQYYCLIFRNQLKVMPYKNTLNNSLIVHVSQMFCVLSLTKRGQIWSVWPYKHSRSANTVILNEFCHQQEYLCDIYMLIL